jgi:hypothetical protein
MRASRTLRRVTLALGSVFALLAAGPATPARAGDLARSFEAGSGGRLIIALDFGSVDVVRHDGDRVRLEAVARGVGASGVHFDARADGPDVYLRGETEPWVRWLRSAPGVRVRVHVPRGYRVELSRPRDVELVGAQIAPVSLR